MKHENFWVMCAAASAAVVVIAGAAGAALALPPTTTVIGERASDQGMSTRVSYRDLNLASAQDERILNRRVGGAARLVCEPDGFAIGDKPFSDCVTYAWNGARPQIALAVQRAHEIAANGTSSIPLVAIAISARY